MSTTAIMKGSPMAARPHQTTSFENIFGKQSIYQFEPQVRKMRTMKNNEVPSGPANTARIS
jgi:hypothetical protein